jgi:hypothetical protein
VSTASEIADLAENLKTAFVGLQLSFPVLMHPRAPLLEFWEAEWGMPEGAPVEIRRQDGTQHSDESIGAILRRIPALPGGGLEEDLLPLVAMHGTTKLGDQLVQAGLTSTKEPLLQFARHLRNACAHGNRWHFRGEEPRCAARLRGRQLDASLHGSKAMYGWLGPGDYLDFLDDLAALLRERK